MSVLVEALSVVVRRVTLDINYPGGSDAYIKAATAEDSRARLACADDELTSVSFLSPNDAARWMESLAAFDIVHMGDGACLQIACVDQQVGPTIPCDWIEWRQRDEGYSECWLAGTEPGEMATPVDWTPEHSRRLVRDAAGEGHERMLPLAVEDGLEYWLDLDTGRQVVSLPQHAPGPDDANAAARDASSPSLLDVVRDAIQTLEWEPDRSDSTSLRVRIAGRTLNFSLVVFTDDVARTFVCYGLLPIRVPEDRRVEVAEVIARINYRLRLGNFDIDFADGEVRYRTGCDVEGGTLTLHMVLTVFGNVCASVDRYGPAVLQVLFGGVSPAEAAEAVLSDESE